MRKVETYQNKQKNLAQVCPQCYKLINSSENRLVQDTCGHLKCRICLLQEIAGCLLCVSKSNSTPQKQSNSTMQSSLPEVKSAEPQPRKSVITSLAIQLAEEKQKQESKSMPSVDKDTCHVIKQSLEKDILFPTEIVQRSTGNFYHLKRVFSQRFFNEDNNNKKHKACETDEKWSSIVLEKAEKDEDENSQEKTTKIPSHVVVQYYCNVHKANVKDKSEVMKHHMTCSPEGKTEDSLHQCNLCDKGYKELSKLNRHLKSHTSNSKFSCEKCGKSCTDSYALRTHERTHTQQKPYSCNDCDKKFSALQNFRRHEKKHKNEKKYMCDECGFKFLTKVELKRHGVTHTNVKAFVCSVCSTQFAFKRTLIRHMVTHDTSLSRIKCPQCESTFKRKDNLERHIKMAHLEVKTEKGVDDKEKNGCDGR